MRRNILNIALIAGFIIFAFWILAIKNSFMLSWLDEMSLFEPGSESVQRFLLYPGGIFRYPATFLTQFLYVPALGSALLIILWLLLAWLTKISFHFKDATDALCFLVPFCLLASILQLDEACLTFESQGYVFYNTLGFTFSIASFCLFSVIPDKSYLRGTVAILLPLFYPLAGFFALLPAVMCAMGLCLGKKNIKKPLPTIMASLTLILAIVIPQLYYLHMPGTTVDGQYLYLKGLPELTMESYDRYLWWPFAIATLLMLLFTFMKVRGGSRKINTSKTMKWLSVGLFITGMICCIAADHKKSEQLRATVLMLKAIEQRDWNRAMHIMSLTKESQNYTMCVLDNLARAYGGKESRDVGGMVAEKKDFRHDENFTITAFVNVPVNHHMGRFNQSHKWATEHIVQYGNRVFFIKYIVRNAIMNGDMDFARKFNRLLMRTMFHREWAQEMNRYIENPSLINTLPDYDFLMALRLEEMKRGE